MGLNNRNLLLNLILTMLINITTLKKFFFYQILDFVTSKYLFSMMRLRMSLIQSVPKFFLFLTKSRITSISRRLIRTISHFTLLYKCLVMFFSRIESCFYKAFITRCCKTFGVNNFYGFSCDLF